MRGLTGIHIRAVLESWSAAVRNDVSGELTRDSFVSRFKHGRSGRLTDKSVGSYEACALPIREISCKEFPD